MPRLIADVKIWQVSPKYIEADLKKLVLRSAFYYVYQKIEKLEVFLWLMIWTMKKRSTKS